MKKTFLFLAAAIFAVSNLFAEEVTVTKTIAEVQAYNNWETQYVDANGFWHRTLNLDENIQLAALPESPESSSTQNGILFLNTTTSAPTDWRVYQARGGFQIIAKEGCVLKSATFDFNNKNDGCLVYGGKNYTKGQTITFDGTKALEEIAVGSTSGKTTGQARITSFTVVYEKGGTPTPARVLKSIYVDGTAEKLEYFVGEEFDPAGLKVMGKYDDELGDAEITSGITWTIDPEVLAKEDISVDVTAQYKDFTSEVFTVNNIVVKEKVVPTGYAGTYTSNVELSTEGGTSATAVKVIIGGTEYDAIKCGTGSVAGACVVTIPAATKTLHFHAAGWNKESVVLNESINLVADAGVSNNTPFTLQNDPATQDYFTLDPKGATSITFTATSGKRFVLFGVNAELEEGTLAAPSFEPAATEFDQEVMVTLTADEGASIFYALDEDVTSMNAIEYSVPIKLEATTTVYAVAKKGDKESAHVSKIYTLIPAYSLTEMAAITPANQKFVLVLNNEAIVDIYTGKSGDVSGIYFQVGDKKIELYNQGYAFPKTWEIGGAVSGRVMGVWADYNGQWELKIDAAEIEKLTYTEPSPTNINNTKAAKKATKAIVNGQIMIVRDNKVYNVMGAEL